MPEDSEHSNEMRTLGNKWVHRDVLSELCEQFFSKSSRLQVVIRFGGMKAEKYHTYKEFIELFYELYYRFAEVSNNPDYISELENALEKHSTLHSKNRDELIQKSKYFLELAKKMRHQLKEDGLYNPEIVMRYQNNPMEAYKG